MGRYSFVVDIAAPREDVFDLWTDLERLAEWMDGVTRVGDATGPSDSAGSRYRIWMGGSAATAEVVAAERPLYIRTRTKFGSIRLETSATFEARDRGTRLPESLTTYGYKAAIWAKIFSIGSYQGGFRFELEQFAQVVEGRVSRPS